MRKNIQTLSILSSTNRHSPHSLASVKDMYVEMGFQLNLYQQRGLGVTGMVKQLVYQHKILPTKKTPRRNVVTAERIYHRIFTSFMHHRPVDDLDEYRKAIYFSLSNTQQFTKTTNITPCMKLNDEVATWSQKLKTVFSSRNHDNNIRDDGLSA